MKIVIMKLFLEVSKCKKQHSSQKNSDTVGSSLEYMYIYRGSEKFLGIALSNLTLTVVIDL